MLIEKATLYPSFIYSIKYSVSSFRFFVEHIIFKFSRHSSFFRLRFHSAKHYCGRCSHCHRLERTFKLQDIVNLHGKSSKVNIKNNIFSFFLLFHCFRYHITNIYVSLFPLSLSLLWICEVKSGDINGFMSVCHSQYQL